MIYYDTESAAYAAFETGVRVGNLALLTSGTISGLFGVALPLVLAVGVPKRTVWATSLAVGSGTMLWMWQVDGPVWLAFSLATALGVPLGARESIPWSVVTAACKGSGSTGATTSVFNLSQAVRRYLESILHRRLP